MNIEEMEAGREMDALVAKLMGWTYRHDINYCEDSWYEYCRYCDASGNDNTGKKLNRSGDEEPVDGECDTPPPYSTSISAAWEVVEKMKDANKLTECYDFDLIYQRYWGFGPIGGPHAEPIPEGERWVCQFGDEDKGIASAPTAPLAICRAALRACAERRGEDADDYGPETGGDA